MNQLIISNPAIIDINKLVSYLLSLQSNSAKQKLSTTHGEIASDYLAELFRGNGWTVSIYGEKKKALLLSDPARPEIILLIVRFVLNEKELTYSEAREELILFENLLSPVHGCSQFCLMTLNGYEPKAEKLENFNMLLQDWSYADDLIEHYSKNKIKEPRIQLFAHNKQTYKKVRKMMQDHKSVAVVQATGTGKSFLISKLLQDFTGEKRLVMAPSYYVIEQIKEHIRWDVDKIEFMTYSRCMYLTQSEIAVLQPEMIVLDEYHRCGAEEWGQAVENILNAYPDAFKFGTTATPVRYLDNGRDMSVELFNGNVAENLNLAQAIVRNILPMPKYVCALYTVAEEVGNMKMKIENSRKSETRKKQLLLEIDAFNIEWERSYGIPRVMKKHLKKNMRKFIVFCKDETHLLEMEPLVKKWFKEIDDSTAVKTYRVYDKDADSDENLEAFKTNTSKDYFQLLFSINMLNEGLHVNDVHGVILLRPTESPNIFYQQIGRCLKVGLNHQPVIFDFVNNFKSIRTKDFLFDLDFARIIFLNQRNDEGLKDRCPRFTVVDEVREVTELFGEIKFQIDSWEDMYARLKDFYEKHAHARPALADEMDASLNLWVARQRSRYKKGFLTADKIAKLNEINFNWDIHNNQWEKMYSELARYRNEFGNCNVSSHDKKYKSLGAWILTQRKECKKGNLAAERIKRLDQLGFRWDTYGEQFNDMLSVYSEYVKKHGHGRVNHKTDKKLYSWISSRRADLKANKLSDRKRDMLNAVYTDWGKDHEEETWNNRLLELMDYKEKYGHCDVSAKQKEYKSLALWVVVQRKNYRSGKIEKQKEEKLNTVGLRWIPFEDKWDEKYQQLKEHYLKHGDSNVVRSSGKASLINFTGVCRKAYKDGTLSEHRKKLLEQIDFAWDGFMLKWNKRYAELLEFREKFGHCNVPLNFKGNKKLSYWVALQIKNYNKNILTDWQLPKLINAGFNFDFKSKDKKTEKILGELSEIKKKYGHIDIPLKKNYPHLDSWIIKQRKKYFNGTLELDILTQLEDAGIVWDKRNEYWNKMTALLIKFNEKHRHCDITSKNCSNKELVKWITITRVQKARHTLNPQRISALNKMGFVWDSHFKDDEWNRKLDVLKLFKERHGDLNTRYITNDKRDKSASHLIAALRKSFKEGKLQTEQVNELIGMGLVMDVEKESASKWMELFEELKKFKSKYGHCAVPEGWKKNIRLALWVSVQRRHYKAKKISSEFIRLLNQEGFLWNGMEGRYERKTKG